MKLTISLAIVAVFFFILSPAIKERKSFTFKHNINDIVCIYRLGTSFIVTARGNRTTGEIYYGYTKEGNEIQMRARSLKPGKCIS